MKGMHSGISVTNEMKWKIKEQSFREKITMLELVEKALNEYFERLEKENREE